MGKIISSPAEAGQCLFGCFVVIMIASLSIIMVSLAVKCFIWAFC